MGYVERLEEVFRGHRDRYTAHQRAVPILTEASQDAAFLTQILRAHLACPEALNTLHYPVLAVPIARSRDFELVANCWIPLPDGRTDLSTKSIHHHGKMLLTTVTAFGPGYEHWLFERPAPVSDVLGVWKTRLLDCTPHVPHKPAFVDAYVAHVPFYPRSLSITFALWSHREPRSWIDSLKQFKLIQQHKEVLLSLSRKLKLTDALKVNVVEYFDFFPCPGGLQVIQERTEFPRGPNSDFLYSLFHVLQETGNDGLAPVIANHLQANLASREVVETLLGDLRGGRRIEGRFSPGHLDMDGANFSRESVQSLF